MRIVVNLDVEKRKMSVSELAGAVDITVANISVLKNGRAKAVRFSTLDAICSVLGRQPGDLLTYVPEPKFAPTAPKVAEREGSAEPRDVRVSCEYLV